MTGEAAEVWTKVTVRAVVVAITKEELLAGKGPANSIASGIDYGVDKSSSLARAW